MPPPSSRIARILSNGFRSGSVHRDAGPEDVCDRADACPQMGGHAAGRVMRPGTPSIRAATMAPARADCLDVESAGAFAALGENR
jgi:hypothetical protein